MGDAQALALGELGRVRAGWAARKRAGENGPRCGPRGREWRGGCARGAGWTGPRARVWVVGSFLFLLLFYF